MSCPKKFYYKTILGLPQKPSRPAAIGTTAHTAFERVFDLDRGLRTPEAAVAFVRPAWGSMIDPLKERSEVEPGSVEDQVRKAAKLYRDLVEPGSRGEARLLESAAAYGTLCQTDEDHEQFIADAESMVRNWFTMENPNRFDPAGRELYLSAQIAGVPLHGFIDRLDKVTQETGEWWYISDYKGLALDTMLPTPSGWVTMGEVSVGDLLFGSDGRPCLVTKKSKVHNRPCYRLVFDDGTEIVCDNVHLWSVNWVEGGHDFKDVLGADQLYERFNSAECMWIESAKVLSPTHSAELPVEPGLLAAELVRQANTGKVEFGDSYGRYWDEAVRAVLRGAQRDREVFLSNMIVSSGGVRDGLARFISSSEQIALVVAEAVAGLGAKAVEGVAELPNDDGELVSFHQVVFSVDALGLDLTKASDLNDAAWDSQIEGLANARLSDSSRRYLVEMRPIDSVPTACVAVDSADSLYLAGRGMVPTHNTGKVPQDRYLADSFFAMRVYAALLREIQGVTATQLRLIYVKEPGVESVKRMDVTPAMLETTAAQLRSVWRGILSAARDNKWPTKTGPLCNWCDFKDVCPAFHPELDGMLPEEVALFGGM